LASTSEVSHRCSSRCLGPLTFHNQAVGEKVRLSHGGRLAEKTENTFKNGLVFSNRPVKIQEKIHLRVRSLPLPCMAIPNLTDKPGHWAVPVNESYCQAGSELKFWVSHGGSIYVAVSNRRYKWLTGVDLSQPLWAMIDVYGQTRSILLLGKFNYSYICLTAGFSYITCVVCMVKEARITLPCGHRCLCKHCNSRVFQEFGTCPLCRHKIRAP
uniref:RING-type domain-containing protein n=1 Tax=Maylandia zebra TaxID=106582 RepID=A0A3P9BZX3_9CICH